MSKLVTIYGGSGFVGRQIAFMLAREGWRVRVAVRRTNEALFVRAYGEVGQVELVPCNIRDDDSVRRAMIGADAVVNCVGITVREGKNTFEAIHIDGAARVAKFAAEAGIATLVHLSATGADMNSASRFNSTKAEGEQAILKAFPHAVILRPEPLFGDGDRLYNQAASCATLTMIAPVFAANAKLAPAYVEDVARAAAMATAAKVPAGIYELRGPQAMTMREITQQVVAITERRRAIVAVPRLVAAVFAGALDIAQTLTLGLFTNRILTKDQLRALYDRKDSDSRYPGFEAFGIDPVHADAVTTQYLWPFRENGEFAAFNASAGRLRGRS